MLHLPQASSVSLSVVLSVVLQFFLLSLSPQSSTLVLVSANSSESYCGTSWADAATHCRKHCPSGNDGQCSNLNAGSAPGAEEYSCYYFTGCTEEGGQGNEGETEEDSTATTTSSAAINNYCGKSWIHAMLGCSQQCPNGYECLDPQEQCFAATSCDVPLVQLVSEMVSTLSGPDTLMDDGDTDIFSSVLWETINSVAEEMGLALGEVDLGEQTLVGRRELTERARHRRLATGRSSYLNFNITDISARRKLPSGSSAVDVSMVITGDYRPPPYVDLDVIAEDSINRNGARVVSTLRERGERAGRDFFSRVESIEAVSVKELTKRPTRSPAASPTWSPIGPPTNFPSAAPTYYPSIAPSAAPSRAHDQVIMTGSRQDLQLGGKTTSSYGYIFNIRTQPGAGVAIITGFDFYTESTNEVTFELWTRLGTFKGHKGTYDGWDLIATGTVQGSGIGRYTSIPPELYTPVAIPGGGGEEGTRAFYLTLQSIDLVYKLGTILDGDSGYSDERPHAETEDIAIYQGEGILWYPFPDPEEVIFYRYPREYLGAVYYNRLPCRPYSLYGVINELPCPLVPTGSPTGPPPTKSPVTDEPTVSPVFSPTRLPSDSPTVSPIMGATPAPVEPTEFPTESPTESKFPTMEPTTSQPTMSPVVPMRANIVTTLRNVPDREMTVREVEKYVEIMTTFLRRHTESSMTLDGIDWWHGQLTQVDAKEGTVAEGAEGDEEGEDGDDEKEQEEAEEQSPQVARGANRRQLQKNKRPPATPQVVAMDITLILRISISTLPIEMLGNMAKVAIEENEEELLALLREQQAFYTFFKSADGVACKVIEEVTNPPTLSPITAAEAAALAAAEEEEEDEVLVEEEDGGVGFGVFVGLGIGFLWCCLTAISVAYLMSARGEMEEQRDMEDLLKAEKHNPLTDKETDGDDEKGGEKTDAAGNVVVDDGTDNPKSLRRGSTVPMGDTEDDFEKSGLTNNMQTDSDDSVTWDHTKNDRLTVEAKDELRKSTNSPLEEEDFGEFDTGTGTPMTRRAASNSNLAKIKERFGDGPQPGAYSYKPARNPRPGAQSMVVTAQESSAILDGDISKRRYSSSALAEKMKERKSLARSVIRGGEAEMSSTPHKRLSQSVVVKSGMGTDKAKQRKSITKSFIKGDGGSSSSSTSPPKRGLAKSMVTPQKSNIEDLEMSLAKNNAKILQRAKTMDVDSKNGGTTAEGGLRKSTTRKVGGVASSMRRSSTKHGSHDNLRKSSRSSHSHAASLRRSSKDDSHETLHTLKYKGESDDANMTMKQSGTKAREKRNSVATGEPLRKSDNEIKKAPRRRSDRLGQSMMY